jgi:hypothetical protein
LADRERAEDISGEDAAWRDLVARFDLPGDPYGAAPPWPEREDLLTARHRRPRHGGEAREGSAAAEAPESGSADVPAPGSASPGSASPGSASPGSASPGSASPGRGDTGSASPGSASPGRGDTGSSEPGGGDTGSADVPDHDDDQPAADGPGGSESALVDRTRVIKPAVPVQLPGDSDEDSDDHYIPPPPPPLPVLDPVAKGAWTALFGGPAYLLTATMTGWAMPGWATFGAVAAFVGGFAVIVMRMGDRPTGSGPDNGAVL